MKPTAEPLGPSGAASVAGALRRRSAESLAELLDARPDLASPPPTDFTDLAARVVTRASVRRCVDHLDAWHVAVLETVTALPEPVTPEPVAALLHRAHGVSGQADETRVLAALRKLESLALTWADGATRWRVPLGVREEFGRHPLGLAAAEDAPDVVDPPTDLSDAEAGALLRLAAGPPVGTVRVIEPDTPVGRLVAAGVLRRLDDHTVELPRAVALGVRATRPTEPTPPIAPSFTAPGRRRSLVDQAGVGTALETIGDVEGVLDHLDAHRIEALRDGGIGVRDLRALARALGRDQARTGFALNLVAAAGLAVLRAGRGELTTAADAWYDADLAGRWATLVTAWRDDRRWWPSTDPRGRHPWGAAQDTDPVDPAGLRALVLGLLADEPGRGIDTAALTRAVTHHRPAFARRGTPPVADVVRDAHWLGVLALDTVSLLAPAAAQHDAAGRTAELAAPHFPDPVARLIVQADLTAVAPGPMRHDLARAIRDLAEVESRGGATVFRFTTASVQRAFDAGWSAPDILTWVAGHSTTGVPQPLAYLVGDVARRHGQIRVGAASCWVTLDDPAHVALAVADAQAASLGVARIADTVLVADADPADVVAWLRRLGLAPAAAGGSPAPRRAPAPAPRSGPPRPDTREQARRLQIRDTAQRAREAAGTTDIGQELRRAHRAGAPVEVEYVAADGTRRSTSAVPTQVSDGSVQLVGPRTRLSLPLARVTLVRPTRGGSAQG